MVFDKTSFFMISGAWTMHERKKILIHLQDKVVFPRFVLHHISLKQGNDSFWKILVLKTVIQLVRMTKVITEKAAFQETGSHWDKMVQDLNSVASSTPTSSGTL